MPVPYWAGHYIGLKFREHGRDFQGVDCWGLVRMVMAEQMGVSVPSYSHEYQSVCDQDVLGKLVTREQNKWHKIESGDEKCGDVIVLRLRGQPMHVGLVLGDQSMLHIEHQINSSIEKYNTLRWKDRVVAFFRHKGVRTDDKSRNNT